MAENSNPSREPRAKRRKVRKGTQSCWECKKRKVRCVFVSATDRICENCSRRGKACVSQHEEDDSPQASGSDTIEARLGRVEKLVEDLIKNTTSSQNSRQLGSPSFEDLSRPQQDGPVNLFARDQLPALSDDHELPTNTFVGPSGSALPQPSLMRPSFARSATMYESLTRSLLAVWPSQSDIDILKTARVEPSAPVESGVYIAHSGTPSSKVSSIWQIFQAPQNHAHPVIIARRLLMLGTFLRLIVRSSIPKLADLSVPYREIMSCAVNAATELVTTREDLINSVEGIECVMTEAAYRNYAGDLHGAWLAVRRASTVAQMMALHRGSESPSIRFLEGTSRTAFDSDTLCCQIVGLGSYLSLLLGLPRIEIEFRFGTPQALEQCQPVVRVHRILCVAAQQILTLNKHDSHARQDIDRLLTKAAADMPPQWWLVPDILAADDGDDNIARDTTRLMIQLVYYHLVMRLHLPYMLRYSDTGRCNQNKLTSTYAAREILARFLAFRRLNTGDFYCRGTDFVVFTGVTVLCIAHIDSNDWCQGNADVTNQSTASSFLAHSRPNDRGLMEQTLEVLESTAQSDPDDTIAPKIVRMLSDLLRIESQTANGARYSAHSSGSGNDLGYHGESTEDGKGLTIHIPHFGTINFQRRTVSRPVQGGLTSEAGLVPSAKKPTSRNNGHEREPPSDSGFASYGSEPFETGISESQSGSADNVPVSDGGFERYTQPPFDLTEVQDDWDLQGIDTALFESLFGDTTEMDVSDTNWTKWVDTV